jgi:hypothetical protein
MRWKSDLEIKFPFLVDILLFNVVSVRGDAPLNESKRPANFASLGVSTGLVVQQHSKAHILFYVERKREERRRAKKKKEKRDRWRKALWHACPSFDWVLR